MAPTPRSTLRWHKRYRYLLDVGGTTPKCWLLSEASEEYTYGTHCTTGRVPPKGAKNVMVLKLLKILTASAGISSLALVGLWATEKFGYVGHLNRRAPEDRAERVSPRTSSPHRTSARRG